MRCLERRIDYVRDVDGKIDVRSRQDKVTATSGNLEVQKSKQKNRLSQITTSCLVENNT